MRHFALRHNSDGSKDTVCLNCFQTVAKNVNVSDAEIESIKETHLCGVYGNDLLEDTLRVIARSQKHA
jgi:hypothetical protein